MTQKNIEPQRFSFLFSEPKAKGKKLTAMFNNELHKFFYCSIKNAQKD
jgi:hypothetical protein